MVSSMNEARQEEIIGSFLQNETIQEDNKQVYDRDKTRQDRTEGMT